jgi:hypothetical protein
MVANVQVALVPVKGVWAGRIVSWLPALFLLLDGVAKLFKPAPVIEGTVKLGYSESVIIPLDRNPRFLLTSRNGKTHGNTDSKPYLGFNKEPSR